MYDEKKGLLYFNENGKEKGWGDGGLFAKLQGAPELGTEDFTVVSDLASKPPGLLPARMDRVWGRFAAAPMHKRGSEIRARNCWVQRSSSVFGIINRQHYSGQNLLRQSSGLHQNKKI